MNRARLAILVAAISGLGTAAQAQFVKGNEAVRTMPDGTRQVETPPLPKVSLGKPCPASQAGCAGGGWMMVETQQGLTECTEIYARPTTCRPSTFGTEKRSRLWIVKQSGQWMQCSSPQPGAKCVSTKSLPSPVVQ